MNAPANITPNLPALLAALPEDDPRKPCVEFTRAVQVVFIEALAVVGSVRSAARSARVSHQTVYRARRASRDFRRCWEAAQVLALTRAEDVLACRAIDGVEEKVFYHGEEVATRTRYDGRLLLAHIGRLDKLAARAEVSALADDFDAAMAAFAAGEDLPAVSPAEEEADAGGGAGPLENKTPEQCNTRSMPPEPSPPLPPLPEDVAPLAERAFWRAMERRDPAFFNAGWLERVHAMLTARPDDAPDFDWLLEQCDAQLCGDAGREPGSLQDYVIEQVLGYEWQQDDWWWFDDRGESRLDLAAEWEAEAGGEGAE